jgi:chemotaxis protein methyltransferase CheR
MMSAVGFPDQEDEPLSPHNFDRLTAFIKDYCGIHLTDAKHGMLEGRVRRRMRAIGITNPNDYCRIVFDENGPNVESEITHLIDAVTTNKTDFFREATHFDYLCQKILPEILASGQRHIKIWSAACSIGAEPYTIAMLLDDFCRKHHGLTYSVLATDICIQSLEKALTGRYPEAMVDPVPPELRRHYVMRSSDPDCHEVRMSPKLRSNTAFARMNLMDDHYPAPRDFDVIFLRNVLIYFDKLTQVKVPAKLSSHLRVGGYLILGHSESVRRDGLPLHPVANTVFQRR